MPSRITVRARLDLKIDADLKEWAVEYAQARGVTLTDIICDLLRDLRETEQKKQPGDLVAQF
jgi:hypothetical protein